MTRTAAVLAVAAIGAASFGLYAERTARTRLEEAERALEASRVREQTLAEELMACAERAHPPHANASTPAAECRCPEAPCEQPAGAEASGARLPGSPTREAYVRARLEEKVSDAFPDEEMDAATRARVVDLLMRVRELRSLAQRRGLGDSTPPEARDQLHEAQLEFTDLTGLGVAEFLAMLETDEASTSRRPDDALPIEEGEQRKRFADESDVRLGVVVPGSVEVLEDGEWKPR